MPEQTPPPAAPAEPLAEPVDEPVRARGENRPAAIPNEPTEPQGAVVLRYTDGDRAVGGVPARDLSDTDLDEAVRRQSGLSRGTDGFSEARRSFVKGLTDGGIYTRASKD